MGTGITLSARKVLPQNRRDRTGEAQRAAAVLTKAEFAILKALAQYRYLTVEQMVKLEIASEGYIYQCLRKHKSLAEAIRHGYTGLALPYVFMLTAEGAKALADEGYRTKAPSKKLSLNAREHALLTNHQI